MGQAVGDRRQGHERREQVSKGSSDTRKAGAMLKMIATFENGISVDKLPALVKTIEDQGGKGYFVPDECEHPYTAIRVVVTCTKCDKVIYAKEEDDK